MNKHAEQHDHLYQLRHSLSHIMAQAVQRVQQADVEIAIGPAIDNGFYYDFLFSPEKQVKDEDLPKINEMMIKIVKEGQIFTRLDTTNEESEHIVKKVLKQKYKAELRDEFAAAGEGISFYVNSIPMAAKEKLLQGVNEDYVKYYEEVTKYFQEKHAEEFADRFITFLDMCEGPHVDSMKEIDPAAFKVAKTAGAYRRGDSTKVMMTRLYAYAFQTKEELKKYLEFLEEAKKRDHRVLGKQLELFSFSDNVGLGLPLWMPKGAMVFNIIEEFWKREHEKHGYEFVRTPHIGNRKLWETSGHWWFYADSMYPPMEVGQSLLDQKEGKVAEESEQYLMKPMNCPFHVEIYNTLPKSYRDLPIRRCETGTVYRFEKKGQLSGLMRVRGFTQDDAHIICRKDQVVDELKRVVEFILFMYEAFGFSKDAVKVYLSLRDPENTKKYVGDDEGWEFTEKVLEHVAQDMKLDYTRELGEAAFYGPKLDFKVKDVLGREWQCSTLQFDFNFPGRFDMTFTNEKGEEERPYMLHRALFGSFERFIGVLIEHYAGAFPLWLAPEQVRIIPVADAFIGHAGKVERELKEKGLRVSIDDGHESFGKKIRNAEIQKVPYILIVGEKEEKAESVSVREFKTKEQYEMGVKEFVEKMEEIRGKKL